MQIASIDNSPGGRVGAKLVINVTHYGYGGELSPNLGDGRGQVRRQLELAI